MLTSSCTSHTVRAASSWMFSTGEAIRPRVRAHASSTVSFTLGLKTLTTSARSMTDSVVRKKPQPPESGLTI